MSVAEIEVGSRVWDSTAAYRAHIVETSEREKSAEIERFGGQVTVDAVYARIYSAIPYAGEVEPQPQPNPEPIYPNYPA